MPPELEEVDELDDLVEDPAASPTAPAGDKSAELQAAMAELAGTVKKLAEPKQEPEPQLTDSQKADLWAIYNPEQKKPDFMRKFFRLNPEATPEEIAEAKDLFADMQNGLVRQAVVGARNVMTPEMAKLRDRLDRAEEYISKQEATGRRSRFDTSYPALADPKYGKIVAIVAKDLADKQFDDENAYFKAVAEAAAETLKGYDPTFDLGASPTKTNPAGSKPRLSRGSVGGTGGTAKSGVIQALTKGDATEDFLED